jgi:hypothetical protein
LLAAGVPAKDVQERLGHASIALTLDLYTHWLPSLGGRAVAALTGVLDRARADITGQRPQNGPESIENGRKSAS